MTTAKPRYFSQTNRGWILDENAPVKGAIDAIPGNLEIRQIPFLEDIIDRAYEKGKDDKARETSELLKLNE